MSEINELFDELRKFIRTQIQTTQAYRDELREWREVAERMQAENAKLRAARDMWQENDAKLRELVADMYRRFHGVVIENWAYSSDDFRMYEQRMRELGVDVE